MHDDKSEHFEEAGLAHLAQIEEELSEIKERTPTPRRAFLFGILQGGGAVVGGILAVILIGWTLSIFGIIPGFGFITEYLQNAVAKIGR